MRMVIIGNSGSGKSTLARALSEESGVRVLDLDALVWEPNQVAVARDSAEVLADLEQFCAQHESWIIEGCYAQCARALLQYQPELVLLDPGKEACLRHCRNRPWEPHKYASKAAQDEMLAHLLRWVAEYYERDGDMSMRAHRAVFDAYAGPKRIISDVALAAG